MMIESFTGPVQGDCSAVFAIRLSVNYGFEVLDNREISFLNYNRRIEIFDSSSFNSHAETGKIPCHGALLFSSFSQLVFMWTYS
jgi:hypothetical protein